MTSAMKKPCRDLTLGNASHTNDTVSSTATELAHSLHQCCLNDILERDDLCNGMNNKDRDINDRTQQKVHVSTHKKTSDADRPKSKSPSPRAMNGKRPLLQKKSYSDLANYKGVHMKILVEGKEVLDTCLQAKYCPPRESMSASLQETFTDVDHVNESLQHEQNDTKKPAKFFAGWFAKKTQSKSQEGKRSEREPPIGFRSLRRSRSFSGRIKDKIKNINSSNQTVGSQRNNYLQPPLFYKIIELKNPNREDHAFRTNYQRRHSDQTDCMLRRPLGTTQDMTSNKFSSMSLERGIKQHKTSSKRLFERKNSNSHEKPFEFPFWSQITDADRSRSCNARIRVSETHRDTNGMLETNLCSTEL